MKMKRRTKVLSVVVLAIVFIVAAVLVYQQHTQILMVKRVEKQITEFENQVKNDGFQTLEIYSKMIRDSKIDLKNKNKDELKTISENIEKMSESEAKTKKQYDELLLNVEKYNDLVKKSNLQIKQLNNYYDSSKNVLDSLEINKFEEENQTILEKIKLVDTLTKDKKEVDDNIEQWTDKANFYAYYDSSLKEKLDKKTASYSKFLKKCDTVKTANTINKIKQMVKKWDDKYKKRSTVQQEANKAFADYLEKEYEEQYGEEPEEYDDTPLESRYLFYMMDIDNDSVDELIYTDEYAPESYRDNDGIGTVKMYDFRDGKVFQLEEFQSNGGFWHYFFDIKKSRMMNIGYMDHGRDYSEYIISNGKVREVGKRLVWLSAWANDVDEYQLDDMKISKKRYNLEEKKRLSDLKKNFIPLFYDWQDDEDGSVCISSICTLMKQKYKNGLEHGNYNEIRYALSEQISTVDEYDFGEATQNDAKILDAAYSSYDKRQNIYNTDISNDGTDEKIDIAELYSETNDQRSVGITINDKKYYKLSFNIECTGGDGIVNEFIRLSSGKKIILLYEYLPSDGASDYQIIVFSNNIPYLLNTHVLDNNNIGESVSGCDTMNDMIVLSNYAYTSEIGTFCYARFLKFKGKNISLSKYGYGYAIEPGSNAAKKIERKCTTKKEFCIYKDEKCKIKLCKIKKAVKMNFMKYALDKKGFVSSIKVKTDDTIGWLKISNDMGSRKKALFEEYSEAR